MRQMFQTISETFFCQLSTLLSILWMSKKKKKSSSLFQIQNHLILEVHLAPI